MKFTKQIFNYIIFTSFLLMAELSFGQYCASSAYDAYGSYNDDIRLVSFNSINNPTPNYQSGYSNFTNISTNVTINNSYELSVYINTAAERGNWRYHVWVWIDWNQDGDFNDTQEAYDLGSVKNVLYDQPSLSPRGITIPSFAALGPTRMRVTSMYDNDPTSCLSNFDGEVEDYTINVTNAGSYCTPANINAYNTYFISEVSLGSLNNTTTSGTGAYTNYTVFTPIDVISGSSLNGTISVNVNGWNTSSNNLNVWVDLNQDGDFNDAGENYMVNVVDTNNISGIKTITKTVNIPIASSALPGNTRMRIGFIHDDGSTYNACNFDWNAGEVEDYTINIISSRSITTGSITPTSYCAGSSISVAFTKTGTFNTGNIFTAQLSDASGSFASPVTIGTLTSINAGTIAASIPAGTLAGTGYRIRVISSNPATNGSDNGVNLTVSTVPTAPIIGTITQPTCAVSTGSVVLNGLPSTPWTLTRSPGNVITTGSGTSSTITNLNPGTYTYTVNNSGLKGEYFNNTTLTGSPALIRTDATVDFDWGTGNPGTPINNNGFSVRWSGQIQPLFTENYTFTTRSDDGIRLWVNGTQLINNWTDHGPTNNTGTINLVGGQKYDIVLEYYENSGGAVAQLSWSSTSQTNQIIPQSQLFPSRCISAASANIVINSIPSPPADPSTTGALICIGSTATLSASGATAGSVYKWYDAATLGTLLKTSANNTDNAYITPVLASTTNYWVSILNANGCESERTMVTATFPVNSADLQTVAATDSWIGHLYDGTNSGVAYNGNFTNYYGSVTKAETFDENFGGDYTCYTINSTTPLENRSIYTETFSVRYRMNSTKKGLYVVDLGSDDGSRLQVDGTLVYNNWVDQSFSIRSGVLMSLNGSSNLVYDFYESGGGNRVIFNNLVRVIENNLNTNTVQNICALATGAAISGDTFGSLPSGISLSGTGYQWAYSNSATGPWTNISGATSATYTPTGSVAPFNTGGTFYFIRKAILSSSNNVNPTSYVATNNSNVATVNFNNINTWTGTTDYDWNKSSNWSCGTVPTISTDVLIPSPLTSGNYPIIYSGDPFGKANNIEIQNNSTASLEIRDNYIQIAGTLLLNGKLDLQGEAQLIQNTGSTIDIASTGFIERDQQGQGNRYRYNDWSSPVIKIGTTVGTPYTVADVLRDGTDPDNPKIIDFVGGYDGSIPSGSGAIKIANYWIYKYANLPSGDYSAWQQIGSTGTLLPGEGFLMKGTGNPSSSDQNYVFVGKPNNGIIGLTVAGNNDYLVGNPYPSAIDGFQFLKDNKDAIAGAIYFWEHYGGNSHNLKDYQAGYATLTLSGGVPATAGALPGVSSSGTPVKTPGRYIPIGQGFFVVGDANGGTIEFNNGQRVFVTEADADYSIFMKGTAKKNSIKPKTANDDERPKFRLGFSGAKIDHRQILLTIDENSTDGVDYGYEAEIYEIFEDDMFWTITDKKYVIQATNTIDINKEIPIGIISSGGLISIKMDALENVSDTQEIYIKDKITGGIHTIKNQSFEIDLPKGEYLNRFALTFKSENTLAVEEETLGDDILVFMNNSNKELQIVKPINLEIEAIILYNNLGQIKGYWKEEFLEDSFSLPVKAATGIYFVQINTKNGKIGKKILIE